MRKTLLASVAASAIGTANCAYAADLGTPYVPPAPVFSWTGCHIGPHVGLASGRNTWRDTQPDGNIDGNTASNRTAVTDTSGGIYGGQLGCDWQFPATNFVIGVEGTIDGANIEGTNQDEFNAPWTLRNRIPLFGTVTGRLGYAVNSLNNVLLYFRGGVVFADTRFEIENSGVFLGAPSATRTGWTVGAGVEWAFAPAWSLFLEGNYYDTGHGTETFNNVPGSINPNIQTIDTHTKLETLKLGVNFRFWGGGGPVVARY
ncbi:MAG: outer membrane protein [Methylocella sp.]